MTALSSRAWTTRTPASSLSPFPIHRDSLQSPSCIGRCFPELVRRKRRVSLRPVWWISIAKASGFPTAPRPWRTVSRYHLCHFGSHHRLATPVAPWERLKIGGGTPPILTRHGWLTIYHGVSELSASSGSARELCYSAGVLVLSEEASTRYPLSFAGAGANTGVAAGTPRGSSPMSCFPPASIDATISAHRIASTFTMGWPTTGSAWRDSMYRSACRQAVRRAPQAKV